MSGPFDFGNRRSGPDSTTGILWNYRNVWNTLTFLNGLNDWNDFFRRLNEQPSKVYRHHRARRQPEPLGAQYENRFHAAGAAAHGRSRLRIHGVFFERDLQKIRPRTQRKSLVLAQRRHQANQENPPALPWRHAQRL